RGGQGRRPDRQGARRRVQRRHEAGRRGRDAVRSSDPVWAVRRRHRDPCAVLQERPVPPALREELLLLVDLKPVAVLGPLGELMHVDTASVKNMFHLAWMVVAFGILLGLVFVGVFLLLVGTDPCVEWDGWRFETIWPRPEHCIPPGGVE